MTKIVTVQNICRSPTAEGVFTAMVEAEGLSEDVLQKANYRWQLKHESGVESLNVAVAAAIMMKQFYDQAEG